MRKLVILVALLIIASALFGYFVIYQNPESGSRGKESEQKDTGFKGPTSQPYVNGPSGPPPGSSY